MRSTVVAVGGYGRRGRGARSTMKRAVEDGPVWLAEGFASAVRGLSDERLDQLLRTPLIRRVVLDGIFWQMPRHLDGTRATEMTASVRWCITGRPGHEPDVYHLEFADGRCRVTKKPTEDARVTITVDAAELIRLAAGTSNPIQAYFKGRLKLGGDIMFAAKMASIFVIPGASRVEP